MTRSHSETEYAELLKQVQEAHHKLTAKTEAVLLVSKDLASCQRQCDSFGGELKQSTDRVQQLQHELDSREQLHERQSRQWDSDKQELNRCVAQLRRHNAELAEQNAQLTQRTTDAVGDVKLLRRKLAEFQLRDSTDDWAAPISPLSAAPPADALDRRTSCSSNAPAAGVRRLRTASALSADDDCSIAENVDHADLEKVERLTQQYKYLERDLRLVLCEKEELIAEKDSYKEKCNRLSNELNFIVNGDERRIVGDLDSVIAENRFLKAQIEHAKEETGLARAAMNRYRALLDRRRRPQPGAPAACGPGATVARMGGTDKVEADLNAGDRNHGVTVVTRKQVRELLCEAGAACQLAEQRGGESMSPADTDYRALCGALFDALTDKNLALSHQRKANKILGARVTELEARVRSIDEASRGSGGKSVTVELLAPVGAAGSGDRLSESPPGSSAVSDAHWPSFSMKTLPNPSTGNNPSSRASPSQLRAHFKRHQRTREVDVFSASGSSSSGTGYYASALGWNCDGRRLAAAFTDANVVVCKFDGAERLTPECLLASHKYEVDWAHWQPTNGTVLATSSGKERAVRVWDVRVSRTPCVHQTACKNKPLYLGWCPTGTQLAYSDDSDKLTVMDLRAWKVVKSLELKQQARINEFGWEPSSAHMLVASEHGQMHVLDGRTFEPTMQVQAHAPGTELMALRVSPDGRHAAVGGNDAVWDCPLVTLWHLATMTCVASIDRLDTAVHSLAFSADGTLLASTGTEEGYVDVAHAITGERVYELKTEGFVDALCWNAKSNILAYSTSSHSCADGTDRRPPKSEPVRLFGLAPKQAAEDR